MEVHHHAHPPKQWKEYITEFLMLFLAVSMGFIAENIREKHVENERSEELMQALVMDIKENQLQLDSLITNNTRLVRYYDSLSYSHGFTNKKVNLKELAQSLDLWIYRFANKKTIFEQMKSSGSLRYIQEKEILNAVLRYEESATAVETRSMIELDQYNNEFRPTISNNLPLAFSKYLSETDLKSVTKEDSIVHPGRYENYNVYSETIKRELENTSLSNEQMKLLGRAWHLRQERVSVGLRYQIKLKEQGAELLKLIEPKYLH